MSPKIVSHVPGLYKIERMLRTLSSPIAGPTYTDSSIKWDHLAVAGNLRL